ncbi:MAG: hypothetical protein PHX08_12700 [Lachnospiraceae bacterium]|nr:hypothetical protein [Lachnospiraceae bacterium]
MGKRKSTKVKIRPERFNEIKELWNKINKKFYLKLDKISDKELEKAVLEILESGVYEQAIVYASESRTEKAKENDEVILKKEVVGHHIINEIMPYNEFLIKANKATL